MKIITATNQKGGAGKTSLPQKSNKNAGELWNQFTGETKFVTVVVYIAGTNKCFRELV